MTPKSRSSRDRLPDANAANPPVYALALDTPCHLSRLHGNTA